MKIDRAGIPFIAAAMVPAAGLAAARRYGWATSAALLGGFFAYFFRDPPRVTPLRDGLLVAPGDGKICAIERVRPPGELALGDTERVRISIFLSVFVLISQNRHAAKERIRSDIEYEVNIRAELEVSHLHEKVENFNSAILAKLHSIETRLSQR